MAPRGRPPLKRESTAAYGGLPTPGASLYGGSAGSVSPKTEIESIDLSFSDDCEEEPPATKSHHGLPSEDRYLSAPNRARAPRSTSTSTRLSQIPQSQVPPPRPLASNRRMEDMLSPPSQGNEFAQGFEIVGKNVKILVDAISDLREFDLSHVVELPELVLVGDQSAGKSSLMSALTEIQLPRDQGMCTRCPANIKTTPSEEWSCKVSLHQAYRYANPTGCLIGANQATESNPFPPWVPQELIIKDFVTVKHKFELEEAIKWAQIALLNHDDDHTEFVPGTGSRCGDYKWEQDHATAGFSPNTITIEISGPGLPALSFFDLPGIFQIAGHEKVQYLQKVIENMAKHYIKKPNALIIWTLPMKADPPTSSTGKVIRDCHAADRTVGVLTNPDHLHSSHTEFERVLKGISHRIKHGYFVTKQPGDNVYIPKDDNYHAEACRQEMEFFRSDPLWKGEWREFFPRCGTAAIQKFLSHQLASQILDSIPQITEKITERTQQVDNELALLPEPPESDIKHVIMKILGEFSSEVCTVMDGDATERFTSEWNGLADLFMDLVRSNKPMINVSLPAVDREVIAIDSDDDTASQVTILDNGRRAYAGEVHQTPTKRQRIGQSQQVSPSKSNHPFSPSPRGRTVKHENGSVRNPFASPVPRKPNQFTNTVFEDVSDLGKGFNSLAGIRAAIQKYRPPLPGLVHPKTHSSLNLEAIKIWKHPMEIFIDESVKIVRKHLCEILNEHLGVYPETELYRQAERHLIDFINQHAKDQRKYLQDLFELEMYQSFTVNRHDVEKHRESELEALTLARKKVRAKEWLAKQKRLDPKKWKYPPESSVEEMRKIDVKRIDDIIRSEDLGHDPLHDELGVAAYVRGYYITATNRFVDSVCLSINGMFFRKIRQNIRFYLEHKLGIDRGQDGEEICRRLIKEDDGQGKRRRELREEKRKLVGFSARLDRLVAQLHNDHNNPAADYAAGNDADLNVDVNGEDEDTQSSRTAYRPPSVMDYEMVGDDINRTVVSPTMVLVSRSD